MSTTQKRRVRVIPLSNRARNRVNEHGEIMTLVRVNENGSFFVESLNNTFRLTKEIKCTWTGWFTKEEAHYAEI